MSRTPWLRVPARAALTRALVFAVAAAPVAAFAGGGEVGGKLAGALAGESYTLTVAKVSAQKGQPAKATVQIKPVAGYHLNLEYPTSLMLTPPAGVTATKANLNKQDAKLSESEGSFTVELVSKDAGSKKVLGELRFAVCTATTCDPKQSAVAIQMEVK